MNYKNIFTSRELRFAILKNLYWIPDNIMLRLQYRLKMGFWPDFKHPKRFTEKLQIYKMRYRNPLMPICVDKYKVREYVKSKGLEFILNELYGVYDRAEDIPFDKLPNEYVIKTTDGSGGNNILLVRNGSDLNITHTINTVNSWLGVKDINAGREWAYTGIKRSRIVIEKLLKVEQGKDIDDYKFFCFGGKVYCIQVDRGRYTYHERNLYTRDWKLIPVVCSYPNALPLPEPLSLQVMIQYAEILSSDFPFVRVDLYDVNDTVYFGELTFYPGSGYEGYIPDEFDYELGALFDVNNL